MSKRDDIITRIVSERERQFNLPGREWDCRNGPADWMAVVAHYLFEEIRRGSVKPTLADFEDSIVKAAAVILAALEHTDDMKAREFFAAPEPDIDLS